MVRKLMMSSVSGAKMMSCTKRCVGDALGEIAKFGGDAPAQDEEKDEQSVERVDEEVGVVGLGVGFGAGELGRRRGVFEDRGWAESGATVRCCGVDGAAAVGEGVETAAFDWAWENAIARRQKRKTESQTFHRDCSRANYCRIFGFWGGEGHGENSLLDRF